MPIHNHPSGNLCPSDADKTITKKIKDVELFMEIAVLDHIIFGNIGYYSFADNGQI
jgi:DNA repair protein RadC